uniref:Uncharacterized protein n=1 Tax=Timema bartmani TaxID=61472 RepID=A0A7R9ETX4_9NEOP|nr:unnamed protein product [Timema bartmani]
MSPHVSSRPHALSQYLRQHIFREPEVKLQSGEWFYRQVQGRFSKAATAANSNGGGEDGSVMDSDTAQVREFIEKLVEGLVNGRLDNVYVNRLYNHPDCEYRFPYLQFVQRSLRWQRNAPAHRLSSLSQSSKRHTFKTCSISNVIQSHSRSETVDAVT